MLILQRACRKRRKRRRCAEFGEDRCGPTGALLTAAVAPAARGNNDLSGQCLCRREDSADRRVVHLMVAADRAWRHTGFALCEDRGNQPRVFGGDTVADKRFRNGAPSLDVGGTNHRRWRIVSLAGGCAQTGAVTARTHSSARPRFGS
ncbi:MAG: hypothetical protein QOF67_2441, partial [Mycobacterium sp.]|nr:hypothetical protein [Mycobacterium sp.]